MGTKPHASFLTSITSKLLPDRDAEHHEDALLLAAGQCPAVTCELNYVLPDNLSSVCRTVNHVNSGLCVIKDHVLPPANEPRHITQPSTVPPKSCALYSTARTTKHYCGAALWFCYVVSFYVLIFEIIV